MTAASKRILVLGGTGFIGPAIVDAARARGHVLTLFNRGKASPPVFPEVETILGDRVTELDKLKGREWDAVIDTWARHPTLVRQAAELLRDHVGHYVYVSTISVYELGAAPLDETSKLLELPPGSDLEAITKIDESNYGALKAMGERAAEAVMPGRATSVRSGLIAGPGDPTDRYTYWPLRVARGGTMLAPGAADDPMQYIDVRDLAEWIVTTIEDGTTGVYNAVGPEQATIGATIDAIIRALDASTEVVWAPYAWLAKDGAGDGWADFPIAIDPAGEEPNFARVSAARAIAKGLRFRAPGVTAKDTLAWWNAQPEERRSQKRPGIAAAKEAELLARLRARGTRPPPPR